MVINNDEVVSVRIDLVREKKLTFPDTSYLTEDHIKLVELNTTLWN